MADSNNPPAPDQTTTSRRPSLLPAFEPCSSSPALPRPAKRKLDDIIEDRKYYPTPIPTSSTGILPSSPPAAAARRTRPPIQRTVSTLSERAPLGVVPCLHLAANGEPVLMGRSSSSSDYQLAANRHISRVHVRASYHAANEVFPHGKVEVQCLGWNGAKVHCRGDVIELAKHERFVSDTPTAQIMVDVQDTRVMLLWPNDETREPVSVGSRSPWALESPTKHRPASAAHLASSPPPFLLQRPASPISPTPFGATFTSTFRADDVDAGPVKVYEDHSSDEDAPHDPTPDPLARTAASPVKQTVPTQSNDLIKISHSTTASDPEEFSDHNEENDPVVHSFGPFGENILQRFESFQPTSPERKRKPLASSLNSPGRGASAPRPRNSPVTNHVINQLAFSRVHSLPLSTIHSNLPAELRGVATKLAESEIAKILTTTSLKSILDDIPCVGEISREGKDAAGKLLESEFYYVPEMDTDQMRRDTVTQSLGKTSIRAARKQHKQYYWKRPRH